MSTKTMFDKLNQTLMVLTIILSIFSTINATTINQNNQLGSGNEQQNQNNNIIGQEHSMIEQRTTSAEVENNDFFRQYLSRGMFSCATKYVTILQKLNKLIVVRFLDMIRLNVFIHSI
jgi:hypothetical protein